MCAFRESGGWVILAARFNSQGSSGRLAASGARFRDAASQHSHGDHPLMRCSDHRRWSSRLDGGRVARPAGPCGHHLGKAPPSAFSHRRIPAAGQPAAARNASGWATRCARSGCRKYAAEFVSPDHQHLQRFHFADAWDKSMPYAYQVRRSEFDEILRASCRGVRGDAERGLPGQKGRVSGRRSADRGRARRRYAASTGGRAF